MMLQKTVMTMLLTAALTIAQICQAVENTPRSTYKSHTIQGFTVLIHPDVLAHDDAAEQLMEELTAQLARINAVVPARQLASLKKVRIWVEWQAKENGAAEFHPSAQWLRQNGYNPEKESGIEINNARNFVKWSRAEQPWMLMHEMAHAFHKTVLGYGHAPIESAYQRAVDARLYESVPYINGGKKRAYAMNNSMEYFAELTEAYLGKNDFFPYGRQELAQHDPAGYRLMQSVWEK